MSRELLRPFGTDADISHMKPNYLQRMIIIPNLTFHRT